MNVEVERNVETQISGQLVDWDTFQPKKGNRNRAMQQIAYIWGTYVFTPLVSVTIGSSKMKL